MGAMQVLSLALVQWLSTSSDVAAFRARTATYLDVPTFLAHGRGEDAALGYLLSLHPQPLVHVNANAKVVNLACYPSAARGALYRHANNESTVRVTLRHPRTARIHALARPSVVRTLMCNLE
jgi:hypothetical protein